MDYSPRGPSRVPLAVGWISYWNLLPLRRELERLSSGELELVRGHPSQVNRWLGDGRVDVAPSSSVCLLRHSHLEIAAPLGVASTGPVQSVYLGVRHEEAGLQGLLRSRQALLREVVRAAQSRYPGDARRQAALIFQGADELSPISLDQAPPLVVTPASASSSTLARLLYRLWFGESAYNFRAAESTSAAASSSLSLKQPLELLIGDEALAKRAAFRFVLDLGEIWRELTDLPFVFAIWQTTRKNLSQGWRQRLLDAAELAQARMHVEPSHYLPDMPTSDVQGRPIDLAAYWKCIHYRLTTAHFRGLALFLSLTRQLQPFAVDDQAVVNLMRWESIGNGAASRL